MFGGSQLQFSGTKLISMISHCVLRKGVSFSVKVFFKLLIQCKINICNPFIQYFININWKDPQAFNWCACMPSFHWYEPSIRCKLWPWWQVSMILWAQLYRLTDVQRVSFTQLVKIHTFVSGPFISCECHTLPKTKYFLEIFFPLTRVTKPDTTWLYAAKVL